MTKGTKRPRATLPCRPSLRRVGGDKWQIVSRSVVFPESVARNNLVSRVSRFFLKEVSQDPSFAVSYFIELFLPLVLLLSSDESL